MCRIVKLNQMRMGPPFRILEWISIHEDEKMNCDNDKNPIWLPRGRVCYVDFSRLIEQCKEKLKFSPLYGCINYMQYYELTNHNVIRMQWLVNREDSWRTITITDRNDNDYV